MLPKLPRPADLEVGDTAGLETCASALSRLFGNTGLVSPVNWQAGKPALRQNHGVADLF